MRTMKGPGIFLSQFIGEKAPFNTLDGLAGWAAAIAAVVDEDPGARADRIRAGRERASLFTPERTANALLDVYHRAAGIPEPSDR